MLFLAPFLFLGCRYFEAVWDPPAEFTYISVNNMSEDTLTAYFAVGLKDWFPTVYPDTCLPQSNTFYDEGRKEYVNIIEDEIYSHAIPPQTCEHYTWLPGDLDRIKYCDTLSVFIISRDTLMKYGYDDVRKHYRILARYDLGWNEAKSLQFIFPYPPTSDMQNMKMYPPYSLITFPQQKFCPTRNKL